MIFIMVVTYNLQYILYREPNRLSRPDKPQAIQVFPAIEAVISLAPARGAEQAHPLVIPHGRGGYACGIGQPADGVVGFHPTSLSQPCSSVQHQRTIGGPNMLMWVLCSIADTVGEFVSNVRKRRIRLPRTPRLAQLPSKRPTAGIRRQLSVTAREGFSRTFDDGVDLRTNHSLA